jgi:tetratricopeptide (TPR) repeat protein
MFYHRRWWAAVVVASLIAVSLGAFFVWQDHADQKERSEAVRLAAQGNFAQAQPLLKRVAERSPNDTAVARELALGYLGTRQFSQAEPYLERWYEANPQDPEPLTQRLQLWVQWKRLREAIADGRRLLELQPNNRGLARQLPRWLMILGQFDEAEEECHRLLRIWPDDPWGLYVQALLHQRRGHTDAAAAMVDRLIQQYADDFPEAFLLRGTLYLDANQPAEARPCLERAAGIRGPHQREALYELSLALARLGKHDDAQRIMGQARLLQEEDFLQQMLAEGERWDRENVQLRMAEQLFQSGQAQEASRVIGRVLEQNPKSVAAQRLQARYSVLSPKGGGNTAAQGSALGEGQTIRRGSPNGAK